MVARMKGRLTPGRRTKEGAQLVAYIVADERVIENRLQETRSSRQTRLTSSNEVRPCSALFNPSTRRLTIP